MQRPATILIVESDSIARRGLRKLLAIREDIEMIGDADCGEAALSAIRAREPDILLVDVELPDMTVLDLLRRVELTSPDWPPLIIFVAAVEEFAAQAFDFGAADCVTKLCTEPRVMQAIDRALARRREQHAARCLSQIVAAYEEALPLVAAGGSPARMTHGAGAGLPDFVMDSLDQKYRERFLVSIGHRDAVVDARSIVWIRANGYYATLVTCGASPRSSGVNSHSFERAEYLVRVSLDQLERELDPSLFLRVHRSAIVRVDRVRGTERTPRRGIEAVLDDGTHIGVSRARRGALLRALGRTS